MKFWQIERVRQIAILLLTASALTLSAAKYDPPLLSIGGGVFNIISDHPKWMGQLEWKPSYLLYGLRPFVSCFLTEKYAAYFSAGLGIQLFLGDHFVVTPSFGPGLFFRGKGADLYYPIEFRSSIEAAFRFSNYSRIGAQFYHISNAGLGRKNPGAEILVLFFSVPL
ncbi:MAG: acyloxyacyl hydrolase [Chlamydiales bacterium]